MKWFKGRNRLSVVSQELEEVKKETARLRIDRNVALNLHQETKIELTKVKEDISSITKERDKWKAKVRKQAEADVLATSMQIICDILMKGKSQPEIEPLLARRREAIARSRRADTPNPLGRLLGKHPFYR